jgi:RNA polymerase sigma-70 factor (ECF subfamily)
MPHPTHLPCALTSLLPKLKKRARRLVPNMSDAEDLVQDTMLNVIAKQRSGARIDDIAAYSMRTLHNQARMNWRKPSPPEALEEHDAMTAPVAMDRLICAETLRAIQDLPAPQAQLLMMVSEGETSPLILAKRTGWPVGTVMSRLSRARRRLKDVLEGETVNGSLDIADPSNAAEPRSRTDP